MPSRAELANLGEGQVLDPVDLSRAEAVALNATDLVSVTPGASGWRVTAAYAVGALRCGELDVRVRPKVGAVQVLRLLARAYGVRNLAIQDELVGVEADPDLSAVLATLFAHEAATALAAGPMRGYRTEDQTGPVLRGRLRMREQYLRRFDLIPPFEVTVDEFTTDTNENRRIRAAARALMRLPGLPDRVRARLVRVDRLLADVWLPGRGAPLAGWTPTRLNARLQRLLHLADLVLRHGSVEHRAGKVEVHGFVLSMAWLFERLVSQLFTESAGSWRVKAQDSHWLDAAGRLRIEPDVVLYDGDRAVAVADAKYKLLGKNGKFPIEDAYQLITYCTRLGLDTCHLIYAAGDPCPEPFDILGTVVRLVVHSVDLHQPTPAIETQLHELLAVIVRGETAGRLNRPAASSALLGWQQGACAGQATHSGAGLR